MRIQKKDLAAGAVFVALIVGFVLMVNMLTATSGDQETRLVYDAVKNAALTCYAVEGTYPPDVNYLRDNYQLSYDADRYIVSFDSFASNHVPDVFVMERGAGGV